MERSRRSLKEDLLFVLMHVGDTWAEFGAINPQRAGQYRRLTNAAASGQLYLTKLSCQTKTKQCFRFIKNKIYSTNLQYNDLLSPQILNIFEFRKSRAERLNAKYAKLKIC